MMEDEERQRKLQAGKAKLAEFRQKKAQTDGQKKQRKKKEKESQHREERIRDGGGTHVADSNTVFSLSKTLRSGESVTHDQHYTMEPESEVSTTAEDCSSEEEDLPASDVQVESRVQIMEDELEAKNLALEELHRELEEIRAAFGAEGVQQLQDFEEALKQRDEIITQLTANLQEARAEKEELMREFLELTEQSQKLQIQFQQLQAGEVLRSSSISSSISTTAADLLQARVHITQLQEEKNMLQQSQTEAQVERSRSEELFSQRLREKELLNMEQQRLIAENTETIKKLQDQLLITKQEAEDLNKRLAEKSQELSASENELSASRQKERMSSSEILHLMKTVEDLQQRCHSRSRTEEETARRVEDEWRQRLQDLRDELDEMYGQQIAQMKQELQHRHETETEALREKHSSHMETILEEHRSELESFKHQLLQSSGGANVLNVKLIELQTKLQETQVLRDKAEQQVLLLSEDKSHLRQTAEDLRRELKSTSELRASMSELRAQLELAQKASGDRQAEHESEVTNYKIKLEMLEREKDAVLGRMAESLESELDRLRTQLLFSHEEELSSLRDDLQRENLLNVENLRDELSLRQRELVDTYEEKLRVAEAEKEAMLHEITALTTELKQASANSADEVMALEQKITALELENKQAFARTHELQEEIDKQRNTFSFAEKNFEVNFQELKDEYSSLVRVKKQLEERLTEETLQYETKLREEMIAQEHFAGLREELQSTRLQNKSLAESLAGMEEHAKHLEDALESWRREGERGCSACGGLSSEEQHHTLLRSLLCREGEMQEISAETLLDAQQMPGAPREDADSSVIQPPEMDGAEHEECRLRLEAQRISLVQIHAAQLELLRESVNMQLEPTPSAGDREPSVTRQTLSPQIQQLRGQHPEQLQELHQQEIQQLKKHHERQLEETERALSRQIFSLRQQLRGSQQTHSVTSVSPPLTREGPRSVQAEERVCLSCGSGSGAAVLEGDLRLSEEQLQQHVAQVIVQMSVEFAQQTEQNRIDKHRRETDSAAQTQAEQEVDALSSQQEEGHGGEGRMQAVGAPELSSDAITNERATLMETNQNLRRVLLEVLETTTAAEQTIGFHVEPSRGMEASFRSSTGTEEPRSPGALGDAEIPLEEEEHLRSISSRLQSAVEKLLITITETSSELEHARATQTELMREKFRHNQEIEELLQRQEELQERLREEGRAREQLALELHRAEGLLDGYTGERLILEQQIQDRAETQHQLEQELQVTSSRLGELEEERQHTLEQREILSRQQEALRSTAGPGELRLVEAALDAAPEAELLEETERLLLEKAACERQAQRHTLELSTRVKQLEQQLEEQQSQEMELLNAHTLAQSDLTQQLQALQSKLEHQRRFMNEQAVEREHERDVFQQEILHLEQQLKHPERRAQAGSDGRGRELQELESVLQEKSDRCSELLLSNERLQSDVEVREREIESLGERVRELQHSLARRVEQVQEESADVALEAQLQTEREALDRKEKEIVNLEEQLEQFREELENKSEELSQLQMQLEIQRKRISSHEEVLEEKDRQIAVLGPQGPAGAEDKEEALRELQEQVEYLKSELRRLKSDHELELEQVNGVMEKLQEELMQSQQQPQDNQQLQHREQQLQLQDSQPLQLQEQQLQDKMLQIHEREMKLQHREKQLYDEHLQLRDRELQLQDRFHRVEDTEPKLQDREQQMQLKEQDLEESKHRLQDREQQIQGAEKKQIQDRESQLQEEQMQLGDRETLCSTQEGDLLEDTRQQLQDKEHRLQDKMLQTEDNEWKSQDGELQIRRKEQQLQERELQLEDGELQSKNARQPLELQDGEQQIQDTAALHVTGEQQDGVKLREEQQQQQQQPENLLALQEMLRDKTAACVVMQAQVQALEESAALEVNAMILSIQQLQARVEQKDSELRGCQVLLERAQADEERLSTRVAQLEEKLTEKVADLLVSQAQLQAVQSQTRELLFEKTVGLMELEGLVSEETAEQRKGHSKEIHERCSMQAGALSSTVLMEKLKEMEQGLSVLQKDQELQKELLWSSEEEVVEYERRLELMINLLDQMKTRAGHQRSPASAEVPVRRRQAEDATEAAELLQELQEARAQAVEAQQEFNICKDQSLHLQELLQERERSLALLKDQLLLVSHGGDGATSELRQELPRFKGQAEKQEFKAKAEEAQGELQETKAKAEEARGELQQVKAKAEEARGELQEFKAKVEESRGELQQVKAKAEEARGELQEFKAKAEETQGELQEAKAKVEEARGELQEFKAQVEEAQGELQQVKAKAEEARGELQQVKAKAEEARGELQQVKAKAEEARGELQQVKAKAEEARGELQEFKAKVEEAQGELQQVKAKTEEALGELLEAKTQVEEAQEELQEFKAQVEDARGELLKVKAQVEGTRGELQGVKAQVEAPRGELFEVKAQEEARGELQAWREQSLRLQEQIQVRDGAIAELQELAADDAEKHRAAPPRLGGRGARGGDEGGHQTAAAEEEHLMFSEKIAQMQELHAAEIMDMESRHISESESLRRENQLLEEECGALRDAVHTLSQGLERPAATPLKEDYTSDSSSDWSQRTGVCRSTPEGGDPEPDLLPQHIKTLLREVHQEGMEVLSLTQIPLNESTHTSCWSGERESLLHTIQALKKLLSTLQRERDPQDWRSDLLAAVQEVFLQERDVLKALFYSHLEQMDTAEAAQHLGRLEQALAEQDAQRSEALRALSSADRNSLLSEIHQLRAQLHALRDSAGNSEQRQELEVELAHTRLELESALRTQHAHLEELDTLRAELCLKGREVQSLSEALSEQQISFKKLQHTADRKQEAHREEVEDLTLALEEERGRASELSSALEQRSQVSDHLREEQETLQSQQLQVQLEAQRARSAELSDALEREEQLNAQLMERLQGAGTRPSGSEQSLLKAKATCSQVEEGVMSVESLLQTLQSQLMQKQTQLMESVQELEKIKLEALRSTQEWGEERAALQQSCDADRSALRRATASLEELERRAQELRRELQEERDSGRRIQEENRSLTALMKRLQEENRASGAPEERARSLLQDADRLVVLESSAALETRHMDGILRLLQLIAAKIHSLSADTCRSDAPEQENLAWLSANVQEVMSLLQRVPSAPPALPESAPLLSGSSSSLLNERLLRQNAELTGFVSRLTEEKNELRNQKLQLEEQLRRRPQQEFSSESGLVLGALQDAPGCEGGWCSRERARLEAALRQAEAELSRLRAELRYHTLRDLHSSSTPDSSALKRLYGRYLRAESFRKALVYQKKYLLLLLGGFQECEEATLCLIARMGGNPSLLSLDSIAPQRRGFSRFRSAARVAVAVCRMKFLVRRWQKASGGSSSCQIQSRNGLAHVAGLEVSPGGVELYRERRVGSRGRTGRESPRCGASLQHRSPSVSVDAAGLICSHLQNYDPDRALSDYIARLEALQRRLGSVAAGSSSYAQLHFGVRR